VVGQRASGFSPVHPGTPGSVHRPEASFRSRAKPGCGGAAYPPPRGSDGGGFGVPRDTNTQSVSKLAPPPHPVGIGGEGLHSLGMRGCLVLPQGQRYILPSSKEQGHGTPRGTGRLLLGISTIVTPQEVIQGSYTTGVGGA